MIKSVKLIVTMDDGTVTEQVLEHVTVFSEKLHISKASPVVGGMPAQRRFVVQGRRPSPPKPPTEEGDPK